MSEQIQETSVVTNSELLSIDINDFNQQYFLPEVNHMIVNNNKPYQPIINLPFPPNIEPKDLIVNKKFPHPNGKQTRAPNAFIIYRKAFVKAARDQGYILPMTAISSMASAAWDQESMIVKEEYKRIAKETHKLVKEMFPKKPNQRKRKERWNLVSFHDKSLKTTNSTENNSSEIISVQESIITPILTSSSSSPNLSELDNISEKSFTLQQSQQSTVDEGQISNNYLIDELNNTHINSFQEYLNSNFYLPKDDQSVNNFLTNWLNQSENYTLETFEDLDLFGNTPIDDDVSQSSLNMTYSEALGIINSENFNLGIEL